MRWQLGRRSTNIEDRRSMDGGRGIAVGGGGGMLVLALVVFLMGGDPTPLLIDGLTQAQQQGEPIDPAAQKEQMDFVSSVLGSTEDVWAKISPVPYKDPTLVVYAGMTDTSCGTGQAAMGPFYCPLDHKLYLDLNFFYELEHQLNSPGDFARAYVIAHEVGHHVQTLMGTSAKVTRLQKQYPSKANALSVKLELQADCYAGVWAHHAQSDYSMLEQGDIEEALNAATQIGDDRLQQEGQGYVVPDSFTHGTSQQRYGWFNRGYQSGDIKSCDTFEGAL